MSKTLRKMSIQRFHGPKRRTDMAQKAHSARFPGESSRYRTVRNRLLAAETALRRQVERVAHMRRKLPLGGKVPEDYLFDEGPADSSNPGTGRQVKLSDLFRDKLDTLLIYSFMFGPQAKQPCPMCTSFLDSLDGAVIHLTQRANLAVVAKSPIGRTLQFAQDRGWRRLRLLSSANNSYNRDYHGETLEGSQLPMLNVFVRRNSDIYHSYATELQFMPPDKGQNQRHIDMMWPLWNLLDLTPEGRGADWFPSLTYLS
jgi:predicted dithiol-disulfide oxidoreductase (DUF899 family)